MSNSSVTTYCEEANDKTSEAFRLSATIGMNLGFGYEAKRFSCELKSLICCELFWVEVNTHIHENWNSCEILTSSIFWDPLGILSEDTTQPLVGPF